MKLVISAHLISLIFHANIVKTLIPRDAIVRQRGVQNYKNRN
jgi:hypothetical protein